MKSIFDSKVRISFQLIIPSQGIAVTFSPKFARGGGAGGLLLAAPPRDAGESTPAYKCRPHRRSHPETLSFSQAQHQVTSSW